MRHRAFARRLALALALTGLYVTRGLAQTPEAPRSTRFRPMAIYVDAGSSPLAAYQIQLIVKSGDGQIVGVEGGESNAFRAAPYYDPAALQGGRIIIAAFSTMADLPRGRTRVATIHMRESLTSSRGYEVKLMAAAAPSGERIPATVSFETGEGEER